MTRRVNSFPLSVFFLSQLHLNVYVEVSDPLQVLVSFSGEKAPHILGADPKVATPFV